MLHFLLLGTLANTVAGQNSDPYKWLEDGRDNRVIKWSSHLNEKARGYLDVIPSMEPIRKRLKAIAGEDLGGYFWLKKANDHIYAMRTDPAKEQQFIVELDSWIGTPKGHTVLDPNVFDPKGGSEIDDYYPSPDGLLMAVSLSKGGSENGDMHVFRTSDSTELEADKIPRVHRGTASGSLCWLADSSGFYYTRYPGPERPEKDKWFYQQVYFHKLGTDTSQDTYCLGKELPRIAEILLSASKDGKYNLAQVANGDGGKFEVWITPRGGKWRKLSAFEDGIRMARFGEDSALYMLNRKGHPYGEILRLASSESSMRKAKVVVPEGRKSIEWFLFNGNSICLIDQLAGLNSIRLIDLASRRQTSIPLEPNAGVYQVLSAPGGDLLISTGSYLRPAAWFEYSAKASKLSKIGLTHRNVPNYSAYRVIRETAISRDGVKVPVYVVARKDLKLNGKNPTWLTGYGGFSGSAIPYSIGNSRLFLENGGVLAYAVIRGGLEFGESWHAQSQGAGRQKVFDDFYAAARRLIARGYTSPSKLALQGASNGGLLVGAVFTQHPEICKVVVSQVGIYDMLKHLESANGQFNIPEYGDPTVPSVRRAMVRYSPYFNVKHTKYPAILFTTGANDPRVEPLQSRKMIAKMKDYSPKSLLLLRTSASAGHGIGTPLSGQLALAADCWGFIFDQLGMRAR